MADFAPQTPDQQEVLAALEQGYTLLRQVAELQPEAWRVMRALGAATAGVSMEAWLDKDHPDVTPVQRTAHQVTQLLYGVFGPEQRS